MSEFGKLGKPFHQHEGELPEYKKLQEWHCVRIDFEEQIHNGRDDGQPEYPKELQIVPDNLVNELEEYGKIVSSMEMKMKYCYLWVINESKVIEILWEKTPNEKDEMEKLVKHSNITAGGYAYNGGEMYFGKDNTIYLNNESDRYGKQSSKWDGAIEFVSKVYNKYKVIPIQK